MTFIMPLMLAAAALFAVAVPGSAGPVANADRILGLDAGDAWGSERSGEVSTGVDSPEDKTVVAARLSLEGQISHNTAPSPDFDGDGTVGFPDFLAFAGSFGSSRGDARYEARFDLDGDGSVAFSDFLIFAGAFGTQVPPPGGGTTTPAGDYKPLAGLRVSDGRVQFGFISVGRCIHWNNANVNGVVYTTHTSKWQRKDGQTWVDVSGTERTGLCSYSPSSPGEYRLATEITINGIRGKYVSENTLSVSRTPDGVDGSSEVSVPDVTLRAIITDSLEKARGAPVTPAEMATLTRLEAYSKSIGDLTGLEAAVNLKRLDLSDNRISSVEPLSGLTRLEFLDLYHNRISDVSPLSGLTHMDTLGIGYNNLSSTSALVAALANLTNLRVLGIAGNGISDVSGLSDLTRLEHLDLDDNRIQDVSALSDLTNLSVLWLADNSISNVSALSVLTRLEFLDLDNNNISSVSALSNLRNIEWLWLAGNDVSNVSALSGLTLLEWLDLESNRVSDLAPLVANTGMGSGDLLDVRNNPLNATSINVHIPDLRRRGVDVSFGASKPAVSKKKPELLHAVGEKYGGRWPEAGEKR